MTPLPAPTVARIAAVADGADLVLTEQVYDGLERTRSAAVEIAVSRPVYGRSTGVGANKGIVVGDPAAQALALLHSHATSAGELRNRRRVRAMLAVRCHQLAAPGSGIAPDILRALVEALNADDLPPVREYGSIGTGDLPALATTALRLLEAVPFGEHDALAFISSGAATIGDAALASAELTTLTRAAVAVAALTFTAVDGNPEAFSPPVESVTPFAGARAVCRSMRGLIGQGAPARIQDPFGLRALPQVHGVLLDSLVALDAVTEALAGSAGENPVFVADPPAVAHHGGFHLAYLATALDTARSALAQSAQLSVARLANLVDPALTGLPPFLGDGTAAASGVMVLEYVATSALAVLRARAAPTAVQTASISLGAEDDASFASQGAVLALQAAQPYRVVLACELVAAVRAIRQRGLSPTGRPGELLRRCDALPAELADRDLTQDLAVAQGLLDELSSAG